MPLLSDLIEMRCGIGNVRWFVCDVVCTSTERMFTFGAGSCGHDGMRVKDITAENWEMYQSINRDYKAAQCWWCFSAYSWSSTLLISLRICKHYYNLLRVHRTTHVCIDKHNLLKERLPLMPPNHENAFLCRFLLSASDFPCAMNSNASCFIR